MNSSTLDKEDNSGEQDSQVCSFHGTYLLVSKQIHTKYCRLLNYQGNKYGLYQRKTADLLLRIGEGRGDLSEKGPAI